MKAGFFALAMLVLLGGCSDNKSNAEPIKYTDSKDVKSIATSMAALGNVLNQKTQPSAQNTGPVRPIGPRRFVQKFFANLNKGVETNEVKVQTEKLSKLVNDQDCKTDVPVDQAPGSDTGEIKNMRLEISGPGCPLYALLEVNGQQTAQGIVATYNWKYEAKSEEFKKETDVSSVDLKGTMTGVLTDGNGVPIAGEMTSVPEGGILMHMTYNFGGSGVSQKQGNFSFTDNNTFKIQMFGGSQAGPQNPPSNPPNNGGDPGNLFDLNFDQDSTKQFSLPTGVVSFQQVGKMGTAGNSMKYFINGQEVSMAEYETALGSLKMPGVDFPGGKPESGTGNVPGAAMKDLRCEIKAYNRTEISALELQSAARSRRPVTVADVGAMEMCGAAGLSSKQPLVFGQLTGTMTYKNGHVELLASLDQQASVFAESFALYDQETFYAQEVGDYSILFQCTPAVCR